MKEKKLCFFLKKLKKLEITSCAKPFSFVANYDQEEFLLLDYAAIRIDQATRIISEICGFEPQGTALMMNAYINSGIQ